MNNTNTKFIFGLMCVFIGGYAAGYNHGYINGYRVAIKQTFIFTLHNILAK